MIDAIQCYHPVHLKQVTATTIYQPLIWIVYPKQDSPQARRDMRLIEMPRHSKYLSKIEVDINKYIHICIYIYMYIHKYCVEYVYIYTQ